MRKNFPIRIGHLQAFVEAGYTSPFRNTEGGEIILNREELVYNLPLEFTMLFPLPHFCYCNTFEDNDNPYYNYYFVRLLVCEINNIRLFSYRLNRTCSTCYFYDYPQFYFYLTEF